MSLKIMTCALWCMIITLFLIATSSATSPQSENVPQSASLGLTRDTQAVFEGFKDRVVKIEVLEAGSGTKALLGSGFYISADGYVITNYHVISRLIYYPGRYRAELVEHGGERREIKIMGIDAVNDLALVYAHREAAPFFQLNPVTIKQGTRIYSMGHPHDIGLSIVEGTYNGYQKYSYYKQIHVTGSLNPGMSGGPTITASGEVVGINVATAGNQVSFLVPVEAAVNLATEPLDSEEKEAEDFFETIRRQLFSHQETYLDEIALASNEHVELGDYVLPTSPSPFIECWGDKNAHDETPYEIVDHSCSSGDYVFISSSMVANTIKFRHRLITTEELNRFRFFALYSSYFGIKYGMMHYNSNEEVTPFRCSTGYIDSGDITFKTIFCARRYRKLDGLYDAMLKAATLESNSTGLETTLTLTGVSYDKAVNYSRKYLEEISWKE